MNRQTYRRNWLRLNSRYERIGLSIFRKSLRKTLLRIPFENMETWNYQILVEMNVNNESITSAYTDFYYNIGLIHGKRVGKSINKQIKLFNPSSFEGTFFEYVKNWLLNNAGTRIVSVTGNLKDYILQYIALGMDEGKDIRTIVRDLQKHIKSRGFYRWQLMRIVRTETSSAANAGAVRAGNSSGVIWEKEWISSSDMRTRRRPDDKFDHFEMDGVKVGKNEKFNVQGDMIEFPAHPEGHPANTINCRCTVAVVAKRDANGDIIFV